MRIPRRPVKLVNLIHSWQASLSGRDIRPCLVYLRGVDVKDMILLHATRLGKIFDQITYRPNILLAVVQEQNSMVRVLGSEAIT